MPPFQFSSADLLVNIYEVEINNESKLATLSRSYLNRLHVSTLKKQSMVCNEIVLDTSKAKKAQFLSFEA